MRQTPHYLFLFAAAALLLALSAGCASTGGQEPQWMSEYPDEEEYFVGIGSSHTGSRAEDMDRARAEALANLAASISVEVRGETTVKEQQSAEGDYAAAVTSSISQTVDEHLQEVETVDSYYSKEEGYWIYLRLNKRQWARIQRQEMERITERARSILAAGGKGSVAERVAALGKALQVVRESAYGGMIETSLDGEKGVLSDLLAARAGELLAGLRLRVEPERIEFLPGEGAELSVEVSNRGELPPGAWTVLLRAKRDQAPAEQVTTDSDGIFRGRLELKEFPLGLSTAEARLDIARYGFSRRDRERLGAPVAEVAVQKRPIRAALAVKSSEDAGVSGLEESVRAAVGELELPLSLSGEGESAYTLEVAVTFRDLPKFSENAICFTKARASVTLLHEGSSVYSRELPEVKEGGIDYSQAHQRAFQKLMGQLRGDEELAAGMASSLGL